MKKNKGFTLIELIAVLVILALIALIVTPLVMNIVKKSNQAANERSIEGYGKSLELAVASYLLEAKEYPTSLEGLKVEYSGKEVMCGVQTLNEDGPIFLSKCSVGGIAVKDSSTEDGWYHYGKAETVIYDTYKIGDIVTYNGMNFYVIAPSDENTDYVTLLKTDPLTVDEVNKYGTDENGVSHINRYISSSASVAYDSNGYGGMGYFSCDDFKTIDGKGYCGETEVNYDNSDIKYVLDNWSNDTFPKKALKEVSGYKVRLIYKDELTKNLGYEDLPYSIIYPSPNGITPNWIYNNNYYYWMMDEYRNSIFNYWVVGDDGGISGYSIESYNVVRPVVNLYKKVI